MTEPSPPPNITFHLMNITLNTSMEDIIDGEGTCRFHATTENYFMCFCFFTIFALSVTGNSLVIAVITRQRHMRSITNTYLLNLAISDLTLSCVCMPPTLHSMVLSCWIYGDLLCRLFAYLQPMVVTASAYTLAVIAFERYFAICSPLHSRIWQTRTHAYCMIALVWTVAIVSNLPIGLLYHEVHYDDNGGVMCAPSEPPIIMFSYQIYMTVVLLLIPLIVMTVLYGRVISTLRDGIRLDIASVEPGMTRENSLGVLVDQDVPSHKPSVTQKLSVKISSTVRHSITSNAPLANGIRSTHTAKTALAKQRVIRMLLVIVVVFFCCWTPSYIWWLLLMAGDSFETFSVWNADMNTFILILTYISSCTNPITYCFMNKKMRTAVFSLFGHKRAMRSHFQKVYVPANGNFNQQENGGKHNLNRSTSTGCQQLRAVHHECEPLRRTSSSINIHSPKKNSLTEPSVHVLSLRLPRKHSRTPIDISP